MTITFVAKLLSGGTTEGVDPYTIGERAAALGYRLTPGVDPALRGTWAQVNFMLVPAHPEAVAPTARHDPMRVARFATQLLGDAKQAGNPVRRHFLALDLDLLDAPDLSAHDDAVRSIVLGTNVDPDPVDRTLRAPYRRDVRFDWWPPDWDREVAAAIEGWTGADPPRDSWCRLIVESCWASHLVIPLPPFGTRGRM